MREKSEMAPWIRKSLVLNSLVAAMLLTELPECASGEEEYGPSALLFGAGGGPGYPFVAAVPQNQKGSFSDEFTLPPWITISANLDFSQRTTNFFESGYDTSLFQGDSRVEFWIPPWEKGLAWGPYIRVAGLASNRSAAWENAWMAGPGFGFHVFPFSHPALNDPDSLANKIFGPLRLFAERNHLDYLHDENEWRPDVQTRVGADYWRAINVNDTREPLWAEIWSGLFWQSANEFDDDYDSVIFGNAVRGGFRLPEAGVLSMLTPYAVLESSLTDNAEYFWENKLVAGVGLRLTPLIRKPTRDWLTRLVVFAEYLEVVDYYRQEGPSGTPDHDFRAGVSLSIGEWYRTE